MLTSDISPNYRGRLWQNYVGFDSGENRFSLYRIQINAIPGGHRFNVVGTSGKGIKESARMAFDYLKSNAKKTGIDRDIGAYDFNIQVISLMQGKDAGDLGVAFYIGLISAVLHRSIAAGLGSARPNEHPRCPQSC